MEFYFLDIGQGTSQVILLGQRRAIVVDCGVQRDQILLRFLKKLGVDVITRLIVSHSHNDHIGGAVSVLGDYQDRIEKICFVQDHLFLKSTFWGRIRQLLAEGILKRDQIIRLERSDRPQRVWRDDLANAELTTYSPMAAQNLVAQQSGSANPTSAVLSMMHGRHRLIFASDSELAQWQDINLSAGKTLECDVLAVPHHAGLANATAAELDWIYNQAVRAKTAVVSVGTSNNHRHPREEVIASLSKSGATVMCTQITKRCCAPRSLEQLRPGVLQPVTIFGRSSRTQSLTNAGNSRDVACAGTVKVIIDANGLSVERINKHRAAVDALAATPHGSPICR